MRKKLQALTTFSMYAQKAAGFDNAQKAAGFDNLFDVCAKSCRL
jgi:hypothetical protein